MTPELNDVFETSLYVDDLDAAQEFYGRILGLKPLSSTDGRSVFYRLDQTMLLLFNPDATKVSDIEVGGNTIPAHGATGAGHVAFSVSMAELDAWAQHLANHSIAIESLIDWPNGAKSIYIRDPAGNSIEFATRDLWFKLVE